MTNNNKDKKEFKQALTDLVSAIRENEQFYRTASQNVVNEALRELFQARAERRAEFAETLAEETAVEAQASDDASPLQALQRGIMTVKAAMIIERDKTDAIIVNDCKEAEDKLLNAYEELWQRTDIPSPVADILDQQYGQIQAARAYVVATFEQPDKPVVVSLFPEMSQAQQAINQLTDAGIERDQIGLVAKEEVLEKSLKEEVKQTTKESATAAALGGGAVGSILGLAAGATVAIVMGPVMIAGVIPATVGVTAAGATIGASYGGIFGTLIGWGIAEDDTRRYVEGVRQGQILLAVRTTAEKTEETAALLRDANGQAIATRHESFEELFAN